jgi:hypothetical protein
MKLATAILPVVTCVSPAFRHKYHSGTVDSGIVRHCLAMYLLYTVLTYTYVYVYYKA